MSDRAEYLAREIAFLESHLASLRRDRARVPYLALLMVLALPGAYFYGVIGGLVAVVGTAVLIGMALYLIYGHRTEYEDKLAALRREQKSL